MTTTTPPHPIDHFYSYQEQHAALARLPRPDSSRPLPPSLSSIARQRSQQSQSQAQVQQAQSEAQARAQALLYSQELHRQQQAQLGQRQEEARRNSEEDYLQRLVATYHHQQHQQQQHQLQQQLQQQHHQQQQHHPYYLSEDLQHFPTHPHPIVHEHPIVHDPHQQPLHSPSLLEGYSHRHSQTPLPQMACYLGEGEGTPNTIKFESPSLLTPPLLLE